MPSSRCLQMQPPSETCQFLVYVTILKSLDKPVEYAEGQGHVAEHSPYLEGEEGHLGLIDVGLEQESLEDVHSEVCHDQEHQGVPSRSVFLGPGRIGATAETVDNHWRLEGHLQRNI